MSKLLIKTTYKALLKTAKRLDSIVPVGLPRATALSELQAPTSTSFFEATRLAFRPAAVSASAGSINAAFAALRKANELAAALAAPPAPTSRAAFSVGQVFRHRQHGYRAVIVARDEACHASAHWVSVTGTARLPRGTEQPFYTCLVDVRDRPGAAVSYVAEDNVGPLVLAAGDSSAAVAHPLLLRHFSEASAMTSLRLVAVGGGDGEPTPRGAASGSKAMAV